MVQTRNGNTKVGRMERCVVCILQSSLLCYRRRQRLASLLISIAKSIEDTPFWSLRRYSLIPLLTYYIYQSPLPAENKKKNEQNLIQEGISNIKCHHKVYVSFSLSLRISPWSGGTGSWNRIVGWRMGGWSYKLCHKNINRNYVKTSHRTNWKWVEIWWRNNDFHVFVFNVNVFRNWNDGLTWRMCTNWLYIHWINK